jgi:hypothetical protein
MLRTTIPAAIALACLAVVETAHAQTAVSGFGNAGQFIVSADRMFGINIWSVKSEPDATPQNPTPNPSKDSGTAINLLWTGDTQFGGANAPVYTTPRLAFDYIVIPGLTVGAAVGYFHQGSSHETTNDQGVTTSVDQPSTNGILLNPRAGYIFDFTPLLGLWARGGFTYYWAKRSGTNPNGSTTKFSADGLAITLDPQLVITPVPHFGITVGPMFDLPIAGSAKNEATNPAGVTTTTESSLKIMNWGISAGILGYF